MKSKTKFHRTKSPHEKATRLMSERSRGKPTDSLTRRKHGEKPLRESKALFDRVLDGVYRSTHEGRFVDVNPAFVKMFGYSSMQEMLNITDIKKELYFWPEERGSHLLDTGHEEVEAYCMKRKDGSEIWVEDHGHYVHDKQGNIIYHEGILRDITERKLMEEKLIESEGKYRAIVENSSDMISIVQDGVLKYVNKRTCERLGWTFEEITSPSFNFLEKFVAPSYRGLIAENMARRVRGESLPPYEVNAMTRDGTEFSVNVRGEHVTYQGKHAEVVTVTDITDRKRAEEVLRRRAEELAALQATVLDITGASYNLSSLLEAIVKRAVSLLDAKSGGLDLCDSEKREVRCVVSYNTRHDFRGLVLKYGEGSSGRVAETRKPLIIDDYRKWEGAASISGAVELGAQISVPMIWRGQVTGVIQVTEDSTTRRFKQSDLDLLMFFANHAAIAVENERRAEGLEQIVAERTKELIEAQDRLLKAERLAAIGETAAMVGHDLRNPLQAISTATYVLKKGLTPSAGKKTGEMLEVIEDSVAYSDRIVRDLLEYSQDLELELSEATPKLIANAAVRQIEIPKNITISDLTSDEPKIQVDTTKIRRLFVNLIEDAVDAMPDGGKLTIVSNTSDNFLIVKFADTGPGIPETVLRDLWKPLVTTKPKGIGLGLAICKRIAEAHGGSISVESKVGEGTTFTLRIPLSQSQEGTKRT